MTLQNLKRNGDGLITDVAIKAEVDKTFGSTTISKPEGIPDVYIGYINGIAMVSTSSPLNKLK